MHSENVNFSLLFGYMKLSMILNIIGFARLLSVKLASIIMMTYVE